MEATFPVKTEGRVKGIPSPFLEGACAEAAGMVALRKPTGSEHTTEAAGAGVSSTDHEAASDNAESIANRSGFRANDNSAFMTRVDRRPFFYSTVQNSQNKLLR